MPNAERTIVDEVEAAINIGSTERSLETVKRVTDLFLLAAGSFSGEQIELFDNVLERLIKTIELRAIGDISARIALAETSAKLASIAQAPPATVRRLARHDEIMVAGPLLTESPRLSPEDLVEIAETRGEPHLSAISGRWWLTEVVTDALLARHYPAVSRRPRRAVDIHHRGDSSVDAEPARRRRPDSVQGRGAELGDHQCNPGVPLFDRLDEAARARDGPSPIRQNRRR